MLTCQQVCNEIGPRRPNAPVRNHLLLGNGFSIACDQIFKYEKLFQYAKESGLPQEVVGLFDYFGTNNFEGVLKQLEDCNWIANHYRIIPGVLERFFVEEYESVKTALIHAVTKTHLARPADIAVEKKNACVNFLSPYYNIFTTNYDLLLYWTTMHGADQLEMRDGFRSDSDDQSGPLVFSSSVRDQQAILFLHGALHLFYERGSVRKHRWSSTGVPLMDAIRTSLESKQFPLFVAEGISEKKLDQIQRNGYLSYCFGKLQRIQNALVTFGFSFGESDKHIGEVIATNDKLKVLYVGLYGDPECEGNLKIKSNVAAFVEKRTRLIESHRMKQPLTVQYYDATSAKVWG